MRLFDLHCDTPSYCLRQGCSIRRHKGGVDLHRGKAFSPWNQCFAAFLPDGMKPSAARDLCTELMRTVSCWEREPDFRLIRRREDVITPFAGCSALLTVENGGVIGEELSFLDRMADKGVRMVGLTWNGENHWGCGCMAGDDGLSTVGLAALGRLQHKGITVDVSHLNKKGFWQVANLSHRPFAASHSNAAALCPHPRNLTDAQFCTIRDAGGVVGLNLYAPHLGEGDLFVNFQRHIEHFLSLNGEKCLCIGSDLDGMDIPSAWHGMDVLKQLWIFLQTAGYSRDLLDDIFYNNAHDFFCRVLT